MTFEKRTKAILELAKFTGVTVTADFLKNTGLHFPQAGIRRIHSMFEGIYKPAGEKYAFSVLTQSAMARHTEFYPDEIVSQDDDSWKILYSAKDGALDTDPNKSLFFCMEEHIPVLVVARIDSRRSDKVQYKILGPVMIESFDPGSRRFIMRGASDSLADHVIRYSDLEAAALLDIRSRLILPFQMGQIRQSYASEREARDKAFRRIVLDEYREQCAVCQSKFLLREEGRDALIEAHSAHIISVSDSGPDDPRNGLSLCPRHHWAFDSGLFTVMDGMTVQVSPAVLRAERRRFDLEEFDGASLLAPAHEICRPHEDAIHWHQRRVFRDV